MQPQVVLTPIGRDTRGGVTPAAGGYGYAGRGSDCRWARLPTPQNNHLVILLPSQPGRDVHLEPDIRTRHVTYGLRVRVPARCSALSDRSSAYILGGKNGHLGRF
jgi:hypothetical protein